MDVRCERCKTEYEFDEARITEAGVTVKCTTCGHVFRVKKKTLAVTLPLPPEPSVAPGAKPKEWKLRQANGNVLQFKELTTLQKWIVERKVTREDEISVTGESWKPLGSIVELSSFFQIVEEADGARPATLTRAKEGRGAEPRREVGSMPVMDEVPGPQRGGTEPEFPAQRSSQLHRKSSAGPIVLLLLLLGGGAYFGYVYYWEPREREAALNRAAEEAARKAREEEARRAFAQAADSGPPVVAVEPDAGAVEAAVEVDAGAPEATAGKRGKAVHDFDYYLDRAEKLRDKGRIDQALDAYGQAADLEPDRAEPVAGKGLVFLDQNLHPQAQAAFTQALKLNPRYGVAILGLAESYRAQGKNEQAVVQYERYLDLLPDGPESNVARNALRQLKQ